MELNEILVCIRALYSLSINQDNLLFNKNGHFSDAIAIFTIQTFMKRWINKQKDQLLNLNATPHSIALGFATGFFWGATPLFGLKTLLGVINAWIFRGNKIAAVVGVTIHDLATPFLPGVLLLQYQIGHWIISHPHAFDKHTPIHGLKLHELFSWTTFFGLGFPLLLGAIVLALPLSVLAYFLLRGTVAEYQKVKARHTKEKPEPVDSP